MKPIEIVLGEGRVAIKTFTDDDGTRGIIFRPVASPHRIGNFPAPDSPEYVEPGSRHAPEDGEVWIAMKNVPAAIVLLDALTECLRGLSGFPEPDEEDASDQAWAVD